MHGPTTNKRVSESLAIQSGLVFVLLQQSTENAKQDMDWVMLELRGFISEHKQKDHPLTEEEALMALGYGRQRHPYPWRLDVHYWYTCGRGPEPHQDLKLVKSEEFWKSC